VLRRVSVLFVLGAPEVAKSFLSAN
jgi:hypothetical protein